MNSKLKELEQRIDFSIENLINLMSFQEFDNLVKANPSIKSRVFLTENLYKKQKGIMPLQYILKSEYPLYYKDTNLIIDDNSNILLLNRFSKTRQSTHQIDTTNVLEFKSKIIKNTDEEDSLNII